MDNQSFIPSHIGSNTSQGKDFSIYTSNTSFEVLSKYDQALRKGSSVLDKENNVTTVNTVNNIANKIANSIIICSPQVEDPNYQTYTKTVTVKYINRDNIDGLSGDDLILNTTYKDDKDVSGLLAYKDSGQFDLVVTDDNGVPACITPPFNDIDTTYFEVLSSVYIPDRIRNYVNTYPLTLSEKFRNTIGDASKYIEKIPISYTPIVPDNTNPTYLIIGPTNDQNINKKEYYAYTLTDEKDGYFSYITPSGNKLKYYPSDISKNDPQGYKFVKVSFTYLLDKYIEFENWKNTEFDTNVPSLDNKEFDSKSINYKLAYLLNAVNDLNNRPYMYSLNNKINPNDNTRRYVWFGDTEEYKQVKNIDLAKDTAFIINKK